MSKAGVEPLWPQMRNVLPHGAPQPVTRSHLWPYSDIRGLGLQLLLPGETAPAHKHTPNAARAVVEGEGPYTVVEGEKLPIKRERAR
jgi:gentisate 1,2-dioxygenase